MTYLAGDVVVIVRQIRASALRVAYRWHIAPGVSIAPKRFGVTAFGIVLWRSRIDGIACLRHFPTHVGAERGPLEKPLALPGETRPPRSHAFAQIHFTGIATRDQRRAFINGAMAIDA